MCNDVPASCRHVRHIVILKCGQCNFRVEVCEEVHRCLCKLSYRRTRAELFHVPSRVTRHVVFAHCAIPHISLGFNHYIMPSLHLTFIYLNLLQCTVTIWLILHLFVC
ncbi:unnamed protein product [Ixodes persulcatus]